MKKDLANVFNRQFTNYGDHPNNSYYTVFQFKERRHAEHFEAQLVEEDIAFEKDLEEGRRFLYAVKNPDRMKAINANFLTHAAFREPMLPRIGGIVLVLFVVAVIAFAIYSSTQQ